MKKHYTSDVGRPLPVDPVKRAEEEVSANRYPYVCQRCGKPSAVSPEGQRLVNSTLPHCGPYNHEPLGCLY